MINSLFIRYALVIIFLSHSVIGMFNNGINDFGNLYLNKVGFAPFGIYLAWIIKLCHVVLAISLITNKYLKPIALVNIGILLAGIWMVHLPEGWFVIGGGRNGIEYNFLLIILLFSFIVPESFVKYYSK
jgi:putative oxidoreductase